VEVLGEIRWRMLAVPQGLAALVVRCRGFSMAFILLSGHQIFAVDGRLLLICSKRACAVCMQLRSTQVLSMVVDRP